MGDLIKRIVLLACVAAAGWKAWTYYRSHRVTRQMVFRAEGPVSCRVSMRYGVDEAPQRDESTLEWQSAPLTVGGNPKVQFWVDVPLSCGWQPEQVTCMVLRDGVEWKRAQGQRINDPHTGTLASYRCEIEANAAE